GIGVLVSLLFSVVPLLQVRVIKPSLLLRDETLRRRRDWTSIAALVLVSLGLIAITAWQAASLRVGVVVCVGFAALALVLGAAGRRRPRVPPGSGQRRRRLPAHSGPARARDGGQRRQDRARTRAGRAARSARPAADARRITCASRADARVHDHLSRSSRAQRA